MTTPTHPLLMAVNISWVFCQPIRRIAGTSRRLFRIVSLSKLRSVRNLPGSPAVAHVSRSAMGWRVRGGRGCGPARDWRLRLGNMGTRTQLCPASAPQTRARTARQCDVTNTRRYTYSIFEYQHSEKDLLKIFELVSLSNFGTLPHKKDKTENIYSIRKM